MPNPPPGSCDASSLASSSGGRTDDARPNGGFPMTMSKLSGSTPGNSPRRPSPQKIRAAGARSCSSGSISMPKTLSGLTNPPSMPERRKMPSPAAGSMPLGLRESRPQPSSRASCHMKSATAGGVKNWARWDPSVCCGLCAPVLTPDSPGSHLHLSNRGGTGAITH